MEIKKLEKSAISEFRNLIEIFKLVFDNEAPIPDNDYLGKLISNPGFMVFVVKVDGKVVGGLTLFILPVYYSLKPIAYIYDVGIAPDFQGMGLGKSLMSEVCDFCKQNDFAEAYVEAESDDLDAVNFYRKTKFSYEMNAVHFTYTFT